MQTFTKFVRDLYNIPDDFIPLHPSYLSGNEKNYLIECIHDTQISNSGRFILEFERLVSYFTGSKHAISTVNGTAALHIALILADVQPNDEVITQPLTFIATANAISYCNAIPVFVDVDRDTMGLSPEALSHFLEQNTIFKYNPKTKQKQVFNSITHRFITACVPMHTFGRPNRIDELAVICAQYDIKLIEDAAESLGSFYKKQSAGTFGLMGTLSFNGNKTITTGGGGMIITDDENIAQKARHLINTAKVNHPWEYIHDVVGYNYSLNNLSAAIGVAQMEQIDEILIHKRKLANKYEQYFKDSEINFASEPENAKSNHWLNAVILKDRKERTEFLETTNSQGVMTRPIWELMNQLNMYKNAYTAAIPNSEWLVDRVVNIPSGIIKK